MSEWKREEPGWYTSKYASIVKERKGWLITVIATGKKYGPYMTLREAQFAVRIFAELREAS